MDNKEIRFSDDPDVVKQQLESLSREERFQVVQAAKDRLCRDDFVAFNRYFHGWEWEPHHYAWWDIVQKNRRACIIAPPETGKTRFFTSYVEWRVGGWPDMAWLYIQNTGTKAQEPVGVIGNVLTDENYRRIFPAVKPTDKWSNSKLFLDRTGMRMAFRQEPTVGAFGITPGAYQGLHDEGIIIDDPTLQPDVLSPTVMEQQKKLLTGTLYDRLIKEDTNPDAGFMYIIMTRWGDEDLLSAIENDLNIPVFTFPARRDKSNPYPWGSHLLMNTYTDEILDDLQQKKQDLFTLSFQCTTVGTVAGARVYPELVNKQKWRKKLDDPDLEEILESPVKKRALGVDWGTTTAHQSAMAVVHLLANGYVIVRAAWHSPKGDTEELKGAAQGFRGSYGGTNAYLDRSQWSLKGHLSAVGYDTWKGESSVELRIGTLKTLLAQKRIIFDLNGPGVGDLYSALEGYSKNEAGAIIEKNDDLVDAFLYALFALVGGQVKIGRGPDVEISKGNANDQQMADAYHDDFDPTKFDLEDGGNKHRGVREYSGLV